MSEEIDISLWYEPTLKTWSVRFPSGGGFTLYQSGEYDVQRALGERPVRKKTPMAQSA